MAMIILVDLRNDGLQAAMGGTWITALRIKASEAIATKYLANPNAKTAGIVGVGAQATTQFIRLQLLFETIKEVKV